ncbi:MAG: LamG domain-containing protein [Patescibacteria group bacterium]
MSDDETLSGGGSVTLASGKVGNALKFDGLSGYVDVENPAYLNFGTESFSLEAWFNWDGSGSSKGNIIRKSNYPVSGDGAGYWLVVGKDKSILEFFVGETVGNAGKSRGSVSTPINSGIWYHVAATRNSAGLMSLYLNGQLKGTAEAAGANTTSEAPFTLGAWDDRFGITELFSGMIDDASVYNRALGESEIQAIFNASSNGKCSASSGGGSPPAGGSGGPGGCQSAAECTAYCTKNYQDPACQQFIPSGTQAPILSPFAAVLAPFLELFK